MHTSFQCQISSYNGFKTVKQEVNGGQYGAEVKSVYVASQ